MFNKRTLVIVKRELKTRLFSRSFIIMTLLIPIFLLGIIGFQTFLATYESDKDTKLIVVSESGEIIKLLAHDFGELPFIKKGYYSIAGTSNSGFFNRRFLCYRLDARVKGKRNFHA